MSPAAVAGRALVGLRPDGRPRVRASRARPRSRVRLSGAPIGEPRVDLRRSRSRSVSRPITAGQRRTSTSGAATTAPTSSSSSARPSRRRTPQNRSRMVSAGDWKRTRRARGHEAGAADGRSRHFTRMCASIRAPDAGHPGHRRAAHPRDAGRRARTARSRAPGSSSSRAAGTWSTPATRSAVNLLIRDFVESLRRGAR